MRLFSKFALISLFSLGSVSAFAAPNIVTTSTGGQDEVTELSGAEYIVYMRKMNVIQKIIEQGNPETRSFMMAMNAAQGGASNGEDIPSAPDKQTTVKIYSDYQSLLDDTTVTDDVKNMMLSDFGLTINSDFTKVPPLEGKIYIDDFLAEVAVERTANAYSTEPQPALVSMNALFEDYGMEDMVAATPEEKFAKIIKGKEDTGYGFITQAHAGGLFDLDKSKIKTESQRRSFTADQLLAMLGGLSDNAKLEVDGELVANGEIYIGLVYKERTWAGVPYKWYFRHIDAEVKLHMDQPEPATVKGTIEWDKGGEILSAMKLFEMGFKFDGWLGPIPYEVEMKMDSHIGMKYYFWLKGLIQGDIVGKGDYYGLFRCTSDTCDTVSERNTLDTGIRNVKGHVQAELSLYPWFTLGGQVNLEALFIDIAEARIQAGVSYKLAAWGYIGNDCRIDGSIPSGMDTAWIIYTNEMYWGYTSYDLVAGLASGKDPLKIAGTPGKDNWREFTDYEKGLFGIDKNTYNAARMDTITGDVQWLDPIVEYPKEAYVGEQLQGKLIYRSCLPPTIMENTVNAMVDYGDGVIEPFNSQGTIDIERRYPYLVADDYQVRAYADKIGRVRLNTQGWSVPLKIKEPSFGIGDGLNVSTIPQNSITLN